MSKAAIQEQIDAIKRVTADALKSKESARKILVDAGIIRDKREVKHAAPLVKK